MTQLQLQIAHPKHCEATVQVWVDRPPQRSEQICNRDWPTAYEEVFSGYEVRALKGHVAIGPTGWDQVPILVVYSPRFYEGEVEEVYKAAYDAVYDRCKEDQ